MRGHNSDGDGLRRRGEEGTQVTCMNSIKDEMGDKG